MNFKQRKLMKIIACIVICCLSSPTLFADDSTPTPAWYRYYDNNGVATISSSVSPAHIRRGYDVLDRRMQVLRHVPAFSSERAQQSAQSHTTQSKQRETDQLLKQAYTSSRTAELKKQASLKAIKIQIGIQQQRVKDIYTDQLNLRRQEQEYVRQGKSVPPTLKNQLKQNDLNINNGKASILSLQNNYRETQLKYDRIISRLKLME